MFDMGVGEIVVIAVVGLLVFGPDRLPEMARQAGSWMRDLRKMVASARREVSDSLGADARYLSDPKGSLSRDLLGEDAPRIPTSKRGVAAGMAGALGLDDVPTSSDGVKKAMGLHEADVTEAGLVGQDGAPAQGAGAEGAPRPGAPAAPDVDPDAT
jgi:Tat protein translocase TatB subunit